MRWYPDARVGGGNTYRIEVHGTDYSLFLNGDLVTRFPIQSYSGNVRVGPFSDHEKIQVRSFRVLRLAAAAPLPALPPLKALNLGLKDVPANFQASTAIYLTNAEYDRLVGASEAAAESTLGRIMGYDAYFYAPDPPTVGLTSAEGLVHAFTSSQGAHGWLTRLHQLTEQECSNGGCTIGNLTGAAAEAFWYERDTDVVNGTTSPVLCVYYDRGAYAGFVCGEYVGTVSHSDMLAQVTAWTQSVDGRIQQSR